MLIPGEPLNDNLIVFVGISAPAVATDTTVAITTVTGGCVRSFCRVGAEEICCVVMQRQKKEGEGYSRVILFIAVRNSEMSLRDAEHLGHQPSALHHFLTFLFLSGSGCRSAGTTKCTELRHIKPADRRGQRFGGDQEMLHCCNLTF